MNQVNSTNCSRFDELFKIFRGLKFNEMDIDNLLKDLFEQKNLKFLCIGVLLKDQMDLSQLEKIILNKNRETMMNLLFSMLIGLEELISKA